MTRQAGSPWLRVASASLATLLVAAAYSLATQAPQIVASSYAAAMNALPLLLVPFAIGASLGYELGKVRFPTIVVAITIIIGVFIICGGRLGVLEVGELGHVIYPSRTVDAPLPMSPAGPAFPVYNPPTPVHQILRPTGFLIVPTSTIAVFWFAAMLICWSGSWLGQWLRFRRPSSADDLVDAAPALNDINRNLSPFNVLLATLVSIVASLAALAGYWSTLWR